MKQNTHFRLEHIEVKNAWNVSFMTPVSLGIEVSQSVQCTGVRIPKGAYIFLFFTTPRLAPVLTQARIQGISGGFSSPNKGADA